MEQDVPPWLRSEAAKMKMILARCVSVATLALGLQCGAMLEAHAQNVTLGEGVSLAPSLESSIGDATRVARVRIITRKPEYLSGHEAGANDVEACGYVLTAKVLETFKGPVDNFQFFVPINAGFGGMNTDYLAVVFSHAILSRDQLAALSKLTDSRDLPILHKQLCALRNSNYVPQYFQSLWAFNPEATARFGGEWLAASSRPDGLFCGYQAKDVYPRHVEIRNWKMPSGRRIYTVKWADIRSYILESLAGIENGRYGICDRIAPIPGFSPPE